MENMEKLLKAICPPIIWSVLQKLKHKKMFFGAYKTFDQVLDEKPWGQKGWIHILNNKMNSTLRPAGTTEKFIPEPVLGGYATLPCLIINMLSARRKCRVLDFAGGAGFIYHRIKPYLTALSNVDWHVVDSNETILEIGKNFSINDNQIQFFNRLPNDKTKQYDVVYINTSLQYIEDYTSILEELLLYNPTYLVLTRLLAGEVETYVTSQNIMGKQTPCKIINVHDFSRFLVSQGYQLIFKLPTEELLLQSFEGVPDNFMIPFSLSLIYLKN
jgi:putative methyltransferase (TIGR04325 family)